MERVDCIVVGARVAGASLATRLARGGSKVVVLEAGELFTGEPFSTHVMQTDGVAQLAELGVLDEVRQHTPYVEHVAFRVEDGEASAPLEGRLRGLCPKREYLDPALQRAAIAAGADLRGKARVRELIQDGGRVVGVRYETESGQKAELYAPMVVGADGRRTTVAKLLRLEPTHAHDGARSYRFGYFERPSWYGSKAWPAGFFMGYHGQETHFVCGTSDDQIIIAVGAPHEAIQEGSSDAANWIRTRQRAWDAMAPFAEANIRAVSEPLCLMKPRYYVRPAAGAGWALVGDAAIHEDPISGLGINHALRDSRALAEAILRGDELSLTLFGLERDRAVLPDWHMANELGSIDYGHAFNRALVGSINASPRLRAAFPVGFSATVPPHEAFPPGPVMWCLIKQLLQGNFGVWPGFMRGIQLNRRILGALSEVETRRAKLLEQHPQLNAVTAHRALPA